MWPAPEHLLPVVQRKSRIHQVRKGTHMSAMSLSKLSEKLADIDFGMLSTHTENGLIASRPMSNNGDVDYDGDSYYFTYEQSRTVADIKAHAKVSMSFLGSKSLLGAPGIFISVQGNAELMRDKAEFAAHWTSSLDRWFKQGVDTPGLVMVKVVATRIHYWDGEDAGEIAL
jgi:general stress protein 26